MPTIRRRGTKWQVQIRRIGFPEISRSFATRSDALEWGRYWEQKADRRDLPINTKILDMMTLGDLVARYRDEVVSTKRGVEIETVILNRFLRDGICQKKLSAITKADFADYRDRRLAEITSKSLARQLSPIRNMFNIAMREWELPIPTNPLAQLTLKVRDLRRERRLLPGDLDALLNAGKRTRNRLVLPVVLFALETAMRRGEILAMKWNAIDIERCSLTIPEAKNGHRRVIPLTQKAMGLLRSQERSCDKVFPVTPNALRLAWNRLTRMAGLLDLHFHDLRHEAISRFFEMGLTVPEVASISGHRDIRMLLRYAHADLSQLSTKLSAAIRADAIPSTHTP